MRNIEACIILTTTDSEEIADKIAKNLIEEKLAACVQIDKVKSFFYFEDKAQQAEEFRLMIKASSKNYKIIENWIKLNHNYRLPQIIKLDINDGLVEYMDWINK